MIQVYVGMIQKLNIKWGVDDSDILVSDKDSKLPFFSDFKSPF